jgi:transposase-like protein
VQKELALREVVREALYETVVEAGLAYVMEVLESERAEVCGARYRHDEERSAYRGGAVPSSLVLGGRRVHVKRPRARTVAGEEVVLPSWATWSAQDPLEKRAMEQMVLGVSTRRYARSLEPLPEGVRGRGTGKSAVSRRFVRGTEQKLAGLMERDLSTLDLVVLFIDGVYVVDHVVIAAVGVDGAGSKHVLGLWEGATENAAACIALLENLTERGLRTNRAMLAVIDGAKALRKSVRVIFGKRVLIQRCQEHKKRNVLEALPKTKRESVKRALNEAYRSPKYERAKRLLENLARQLAPEHPGAAAALREGLEETLTVKQLGVSGALERSLSTTNLIENLIGRVRTVSARVKRWRGGQMILRWSAAGVLEAEQHFRRLKGHEKMRTLVAALRKHDAATAGTATSESAVAAA